MSRRLRILIGGLILSILLVGVHRFGRSLWHPLIVKGTGGQTIPSVVRDCRAKQLGLSADELQQVHTLTLLALKQERILELWGKDAGGNAGRLRTYPFFGFSGKTGPKLAEGDLQIPEGIYRIEYVNPNSSYHLSVKLDYPNAFDREKGESDGRRRLGFDIFIHGNSLTVGCIPIGDEGIEDLFTIIAQAGKEKAEVIIAPWDFRIIPENPDIAAIDWEDELYRKIREAITTALPPVES
jgi:murein L,D-transpeptidase YafK